MKGLLGIGRKYYREFLLEIFAVAGMRLCCAERI
jgi:hypothetical protein